MTGTPGRKLWHERWHDRWCAWRDRVLTSPGFRRRAARSWFMRPIARRRARALFDLVAGFVYSQVLLACVRLKLFEVLAQGPQTAVQLAARFGIEPATLERLLTAAAALDLVELRSGGRWGLGALGAPLVGNEAVTSMVEHHAVLYADLQDPLALLRGRDVVVAFVWDFDRTLIVGDQQEALFAEYGLDGAAFWAEVDALPGFHRERGEIISPESAYLLHLLAYVEAGLLPGLDNARLRELGARLQPSPGIPAFLDETRCRAATDPPLAARGIVVEHYVVSAGLRPMIEGSPIGPFLDGIWASTFVEHSAPPGYLSSGRPAHHPGCALRRGRV